MAFWQSQESLLAWQWVLRALVLYGWLWFVTKLMGQRSIGRLTLFDFVIAISIGSIVASTLSTAQAGVVGAVISVATFGALDIILGFLTLKFSRFRRVVEDEPIVVVKDGRLLEKTMGSARLNLDSLLMGLRKKNIFSPSDVEFAILEADGTISVIPKSQARPVTPADLSLPTGYEGMATVLVEDGNMVEDNLRENQLSREWLMQQLKQQGITDVSAVMAAVLDTKGRLYVSKKSAR